MNYQVNDTVLVMIMGHIVNAKIVNIIDDKYTPYRCEFIRDVDGKESILLDWSGQWKLNKGDLFKANDNQISRAFEHISAKENLVVI